MISPTAQQALDYYGGAELWKNSRQIEAEVSVTGLVFVLKRRPYFDHARIVLDIDEQHCRLRPIGRHEQITGVLDRKDVWLEDANGMVIARREHARHYFPYGRRLLYWDDLDMTYFANYAFWNYLTFPRLLMNEAIRWCEVRPGLLRADFPDGIETHSRSQEFITDTGSGRLLQHNYTADVISSLARVGNVTYEHTVNGKGIPYISRRKVKPRTGSGNVMNSPVMIDITVHRFDLR